MIAKEVENIFVARNELSYNFEMHTVFIKNYRKIIFSVTGNKKLYYQQLCPRSKYKELEVKYLKAQETIEQLQKELKSMKEAQGSFLNINDSLGGAVFVQLLTKNTPTRILK